MTVIVEDPILQNNRPSAPVPVPGQRYFVCDDNGCYYTFVATDLEHAKKILADSGMVTVAETDAAWPGIVPVEWSEIGPEKAATTICNDMEGHRGPLTEFGPGDWFTSEY